MSIIADKVRRLDGQLDRIPFLPFTTQNDIDQKLAVSSSPRILELQRIAKALSATSSTVLLSSSQILMLLQQATPPEFQADDGDQISNSIYETELHWLIISKATIQVYGLLLENMLEQIIPLVDEIWYWDEVLGSYSYSSLLAIQKSPLRFWSLSKNFYYDLISRITGLTESSNTVSVHQDKTHILSHWKQFYKLVREGVQERSFADLQRHVLSPIALCRSEARHNQARLKQMREISAIGLGILMEEALRFNFKDEHSDVLQSEAIAWKVVVEQTVTLLDIVLKNIPSSDLMISRFEDEVSAVTVDPEILHMKNNSQVSRPPELSMKLEHILKFQIPKYTMSTRNYVYKYSRPSPITRYWLPITALFLSSTTALKVFVNRKENIVRHIQNLGETARDFLLNWVLEPVKRLISTIRHDPNSELAIMSKESLRGDRDSLERMVVEFAIDSHNFVEGNTAISQAQISEIRAKVREGDLTPVLRAYEKDLRHPLIGTLRGDLVRTLLIQVQKTKVDVEIALSGIDALLKSQELVFGLVGLTPGILVCFSILRYLGGIFTSRKGLRQGQISGNLVRVLRNIDRIFSMATVKNDKISYKDYGLLLYEVHALRKNIGHLFPGAVKKEFLDDIGDLCNIDSGFRAQLKALHRIIWVYSKWLS